MTIYMAALLMLTLFFLLVLAYWPWLYNVMFACACCIFQARHLYGGLVIRWSSVFGVTHANLSNMPTLSHVTTSEHS